MTCLAGIIDKINDCVWLGGDSLGSNGYDKAVYIQTKVFRNKLFKNVIMGSTNTFRHIDLLRYSDNLFEEIDLYKNTQIDHEYMVTKFIPNLINLFNGGIKSIGETDRGANLIVCVKNKIFEIQEDYSVLEPMLGFCSVGCGQNFAYGSMFSTKDLDIPIPKKIELALESAEQCGCGVQRPFTIINTKDDEIITIT